MTATLNLGRLCGRVFIEEFLPAADLPGGGIMYNMIDITKREYKW